MPIQSAAAVRINLKGDGKSDKISLDLKKTLVSIGDSKTYSLLPAMPDSIIQFRIGGPSISPQANDFVGFELVDGRLELKFAGALLDSKDLYTIEIVFGFDGYEPPLPEPELTEQTPVLEMV